MEFSGKAATLVSTLPLGDPQPAIWLHARRLWIHDITLDFAVPLDVRLPGVVASRKPNAYGLRLGGVRDPHLWISETVLVERVHVSHARGGGIQVSYASNVTVRDCHVRQVLGNGLGFDDCVENVLAEDNDIARDRRRPAGHRHRLSCARRDEKRRFSSKHRGARLCQGHCFQRRSRHGRRR